MSEQGGPAYRLMRDMAADERPREKLAKVGPGPLSDAELIALILGSGTQGRNVLDLARDMLAEAGGIAGLVRADVKQLQRLRGLGPAKAAQIAAAIELGRRMRDISPESRPLLLSAAATYAYIGGRLFGQPVEQLYVIALDTRGRLLGEPKLVGGGVDQVRARVAEVFREPIVLQAKMVVLCHNHPSGDPRPSAADIGVTADLIRAGRLFDIKVLDHVVVSDNRYVSMREELLGFGPSDV